MSTPWEKRRRTNKKATGNPPGRRAGVKLNQYQRPDVKLSVKDRELLAQSETPEAVNAWRRIPTTILPSVLAATDDSLIAAGWGDYYRWEIPADYATRRPGRPASTAPDAMAVRV